jgi:hypothetical protein
MTQNLKCLLILDNIIFDKTLDFYHSMIVNHYDKKCKEGFDPNSFYETRSLNITNYPIVPLVKKIIETKLKVELFCDQAQLQVWPVGTHSPLHKHEEFGREITDYNSLLYLNSNFNGGTFYTDSGISINPMPGRLTFFNGRDVMHGVTPVENNHRYTIIFWWKKTKFF